jgi:hypothetical protein
MTPTVSVSGNWTQYFPNTKHTKSYKTKLASVQCKIIIKVTQCTSIKLTQHSINQYNGISSLKTEFNFFSYLFIKINQLLVWKFEWLYCLQDCIPVPIVNVWHKPFNTINSVQGNSCLFLWCTSETSMKNYFKENKLSVYH